MVGTNAVSSPPSQTLPRSTAKAVKSVPVKPSSMEQAAQRIPVSFTNPTEMWEMVTKQIDAEKLKTLRTFGQDTLTKGGKVANQLSEKANTASQWLMTTARTHPYAFVMTLMLSGIASLFVGSFLLLIGVWVMILAGVLASFCMVGFVVFSVVLMTTWCILFTLVSAGAALYLPYILYMGLEAGWFAKIIGSIKATVSQINSEVRKLAREAIDLVLGEEAVPCKLVVSTWQTTVCFCSLPLAILGVWVDAFLTPLWVALFIFHSCLALVF